MEAAELVEKILSRDRRALARAISHIEADSSVGREVRRQLYPSTGRRIEHPRGLRGVSLPLGGAVNR